MSDSEDRDFTQLEPVAERLRAQRAELSGMELDDIKQRARRRAATTGGRQVRVKSRLATGLLAVALVGSGGGAVLAATGGSSSQSSSSKPQYCPPKSPGGTLIEKVHGKPGNKCGTPGSGGNPNNGH